MNRTAAMTAALVLACVGACEKSPGGRSEPAKSAPAAPAQRLVESLEAPAAPPIAATPRPPIAEHETAPARSFAEFLPSVHGFAFRNGFEGSPLPFELPGLEKNLKLPNRFGLCGGMSFAAADYFVAGRPIPADVVTPPARGTPLYDYLYARQTASLGMYGVMGLKFLEWMRLPDGGPDGTRARTAAGLGAIRAKIARGSPVVLGLVLSDGKSGALWENHQVLAFAWDGPDAPGPGEPTSIRVYDSNFPERDDVVIRCEKDADGVKCARAGGGRRESPVRGFFEMAYRAAPPPADR